MAQVTFNGKVVLSGSNTPLPKIKVEVWHTELGNVGSATTNSEGVFSITTTSLVTPGQTVTYKLFRNGQPISETAQAYVNGEQVTLSVSASDLDSHVNDNVPIEEVPNYILVKGVLNDEAGAILQNANIKIYESGFRTKTLLGVTKTDNNGQYSYQISTKIIGHAKASNNSRANRSIRVEASTDANEVIAASDDLSTWDDILDVNLVAIDNGIDLGSLVLSEFDQMVAQVNYITESTAIADISADGANETNEIAFVANSMGRHEKEVEKLVKAHQYANQLSANSPKLMFALTKNSQAEENPVLKLTAEEIRDAIAEAIQHKTISSTASGDIDNFVNAAKAFQVSETKNLKVNNETFKLGDVLTPIFPDTASLNNFLAAYNDSNRATSEQFWTRYEGTPTVPGVGAELARRAKMGLQLSALTGFQPEVITSLLPESISNEGIHEFASLTETDWKNRIDQISASSSRPDGLVVPGVIKAAVGFVAGSQNAETANAAKLEYAKTLKTTFQELYPLTNIKGQLSGSGGAALIADDEKRNAVITFIDNNPDVDLRLMKVYDINSSNSNLAGTGDLETLQNSLVPFQRILRITGGKPEAVVAMKAAGLDSAEAVLELSVEDFAANYGALLGGANNAAQAYSTAKMINTVASTAVIGFNASASPSFSNVPVFPSYSQSIVAQAADDPNLRVLFGNLDYCSCQECLSVYSPAAYLTDMLNFLRQRCPDGYAELVRRRGDLIHIDLTCKNTNTPVPYIDLVNELLENYVLDKIKGNYTPTVVPPLSYQTNGTAAELAAHPEHVEKKSGVYVDNTDYPKVYDDILSQVVYPYSLPFTLGLEEARVYFEHLGISRYELMKLYRTYNIFVNVPPTNQVTDFGIYAEALGTSHYEATIIVDNTISALWLYYGIKQQTVSAIDGIQDPAGGSALLTGNWDSLMVNRIDVLLQQARITYKELLQFRETDILNLPNSSGIRGITIDVNNSAADPDTCNLAELKLVFSGSATSSDLFSKLFRFVRLLRRGKLNINEWDVLFRSLNVVDINNTVNGTGTDFQRIGRALALAERLNIKPTYLATWWNNIDTHQYTNYNSDLLTKLPSVYDSIFRNRSVINPPLAEFTDLGSLATGALPSSSALPTSFAGFTAAIAACCGIKEEELLMLLDYIGLTVLVPVNISALSRLYALSQIAKGLNYSIREFITAMLITNTHLPSFTYSAAFTPSTANVITMLGLIEDIVTKVEGLKKSSFSLDELSYLILDVDATGAIAQNKKNIQSFYEDLRKELKTFPAYVKPATVTLPNTDPQFLKLSNVVYQRFTKEFNVSTEWLNAVFPALSLSGGDPDGFIYDLLNTNFIQSILALAPGSTIPGSGLAVNELYKRYVYLEKVFSVAKRLKLNAAEFTYLYTPANSGVVGFSFQSLPANSVPSLSTVSALSSGLMRLERWLDVKGALKLVDDDLVELLMALNQSDKIALLAIIDANTNWGSMALDLLGPAGVPGAVVGPSGLLNTSFAAGDFTPSNDRAPLILLKVKTLVDWSRSTGLNPTAIRTALLTFPHFTLSDAHNVLLAAKSKHSEEDWLKIAKPLRDVLRGKQRKALVDYVITLAEPANGKKWRNENEVYAYFLIDVEMTSCMMTSRIKQAISSVQLFVDRILLGIEYRYVSSSSSPKITMSPQYTRQWESWRKWYRVWEANRKVFLYPENWIEPELRDDKSVFFKELEAELLEGEITADKVEESMKSYLVKLDDVSRLEPVGNYYEPDNGLGKSIVHAIGRTYGAPHRYYYRRLIDSEWTAWERIELDINSDHVVPYVWNRRLHLFWLTFREVQTAARKDVIDNLYKNGSANGCFFNDNGRIVEEQKMDNNDTKYSYKGIEVTLNWSEYKNGRWLSQKVGKDKMVVNINPRFVQDVTWHSNVSPTNQKAFKDYYRFLSKNGELSLFEMFKSRIFMYAQNEGDATGNFYILLLYPHDFWDLVEDTAYYLQGFLFQDSSAEPRVWREGFSNWNQPAPKGTVFSNQRFLQRWDNNILNLDGPYKTQLDKKYIYQEEKIIPNLSVIYRNASTPMLNKTFSDGYFRITSGSAFWDIAANNKNPMGDRFFFEDKRNTFYVYRVGTTNVVTYQTYNTSPTVDAKNPNLGNLSNIFNQTFSQYQPITGNGGNTVTANAPFNGTVTITQVVTQGVYRFLTFYHPRVKDFIKRLYSGGIPNLLDIRAQIPASGDTMNFSGNYLPTSLVSSPYPTDIVEFDYGAAYSCYNWEIFFHMPMLIAQRLMDNQQFEDARKWYHYIFDPTSNVDANGASSTSKQRFWRFRPFYNASGGTIQTLSALLNDISNNVSAAVSQVSKWEDNPFKPHLIARMRIVAYMKNVVMKYIDNLIAWGDQLFRRNTLESINEATQLYILAYNILGPKPQEIPKRGYNAPNSFYQLLQTGTIDAFSNARVKIEGYIDNYIKPPSVPGHYVNTGQGQEQRWVPEGGPKMFYFCLAVNDKLLKYWDIIADRLFKIRNCMNIEGAVQQLPLFEPPIDPALLVKAAAAGIDINSLLDDISGANQPMYKFGYIIQKANEVCGDVKALGSALLSALEKKDAEQLALLRSGQELAVLESVKQLKKIQLDEAKANLDALGKTKESAQARYQYYSSRPFMNNKETQHIELSKRGTHLQEVQGNLSSVASFLSIIPEFNIQAPFAVGPSFGGRELSAMMMGISTKVGVNASMKLSEASQAATMGGYERRMDDWKFQADGAQKEMAQIDKQMVAAQIRIAIAEKDVRNQELQITNSKETDAFMRSKYTNKELYNWMSGQLSSTYFQAYQLAYDLAKKAEKTFVKELAFAPQPAAGHIKFGYWDSLKKGLLAAEKLQLDLRKMELAYMDANKREQELTKHVSIALFDPEKLIELRESGTCTLHLSSWMFELDYPSHYFRRIKSVSISIPCVAGPYTTIACQLTMTSSGTTVTDATGASVNVGGNAIRSIATSTAQNDSGLFELTFKEERYLPFEGCGVEESDWTISLMDSKMLRQFDYDSISDVILHIKYTAQNGRVNPAAVKTALEDRLKGTIPSGSFKLPRYFSMRHEFAKEMHAGFSQLVRFGTNPANAQVARAFVLPIRHEQFPYFCAERSISVVSIHFLLRPTIPSGHIYRIEIGTASAQNMAFSALPVANYLASYSTAFTLTPGATNSLPFKLYKYDSATESVLNEADVEDIFIICEYKVL